MIEYTITINWDFWVGAACGALGLVGAFLAWQGRRP